MDILDVSRPDHIEFQEIWRSLVWGRSWLQSTIGACTTDDQMWLPPIVSGSLPYSHGYSLLTSIQTMRPDQGIEIDTSTRIRVLIPIEITRISFIAARALRILAACTTPDTLLPAVRGLFGEIGDWYDSLPAVAGATELSQTPWNDDKVSLAHVHLSHLGAITLIFRRTLSVYKHKPPGQKHLLQPAERSQLATIFNDGIIAAKQSARILYLFLGEQAGVRHCLAVMYVLPSTLHSRPSKLIPKQIHRLRLRGNPAVLHQPNATPRLPRVRMAAPPKPRRQRHGNSRLLRRTRPRRKQAPRHPVAVHAIPPHAFSRAETKASPAMGSRNAQATNQTAKSRGPRHRRYAPHDPSRPRRPSANERRPAQTRVPAVQRRC